ncbi:MAG: PD40 domain-containing protein, partial [Acidobacteria bacterium]|nr:PD40 domain-containing protein [Acidobacteriota bacterium]
MRRAASAQRPRLIRPLLSFALCSILFAAPLTLSSDNPAQAQRKAQAGREKRVKAEPARPGAPEASLPNLDAVRRSLPPAPQAPPPVPSTVRSRRKPLQSRQGRRVSDPRPTPARPTPTPVSTPTPVQTPTPAVMPTPLPKGAGGAGEGGLFSAGFGPVNTYGGMNGYDFSFTRFIVSPFDDQPRFVPGPASYPGASFDLFALAPPQAGGTKLVFSSDRDGHTQIYTMNADGSGQARLTNNGANDDGPRFSPDGTKIVFRSDRDDPSTGAGDIYVMNADGTNQQRLTTDANDDSAPSWSSDGSRIVFQSLRNGQFYQVYVMNADGSNQINLSNSTGSDREPSWSPDGAKIAFASERDRAGYASVYVMNADGTNQQRLTFGAGSVADEQPAWSRDGGRIAYVSTRDSEVESWQEADEAGGVIYRTAVRTNKEIYLMNADGTGQTRLTNDPGNDDSPYWSPDGSKLVFRSDRLRDCCDPTSQVWVMNADGTGLANLSGSQYGDYGASWTADGGNQPPVADAGGSYSGITAQNTVFSGTGSFDPDGSITSYSWSFGDGGTGSGASPSHAYGSQGSYTVTLTVTDNSGARASDSTTVNISSSSSDQFVQNFLQWGLARQPNGDEGSYWSDILRAAYPRGQGTMLLAMREFGMTVFESAEYAARNRSDHWYIYDLYKTYLMREPDPSGWAWWEGRVPEMGREQLRQAFDESVEFNNIVATLTASGTPSSAASSLATARVDLFNQPGDQIRARDCEWGVSLLSLPGRAGLDLGLGLSYSSLVWTRSGPYAYFDEDRGSPSPGFQLGFATIRGPYFDAQAAKNVYVLVTSSGRRVSLRQVGTSNTYEAADSSYLQLTAGGGGLLLRSTDGTQVSYSASNNGWRATLIEDRNG